MSDDEEVIRLENVWKIFGDRADEAMAAIQKDNLSKAEVLGRNSNALWGSPIVRFRCRAGKFSACMGLSGSGKSTMVRHLNRLIEPTSGKINVSGQGHDCAAQRGAA